MRVGIVGSRNAGRLTPEQICGYIPKNCREVVSGGAGGVDTLAQRAAFRLGLPFTCIPPDYARYGKSAPIVRNREIVAGSDMVLAFWDYYSRGTANTIVCCVELGVPVKVIGLDEI